jgi:hypothetical protein
MIAGKQSGEGAAGACPRRRSSRNTLAGIDASPRRTENVTFSITREGLDERLKPITQALMPHRALVFQPMAHCDRRDQRTN